VAPPTNVAKLLINDAVCTFHPLKLRSYWTKVHQIFARCSQIIALHFFEIEIANATNKCDLANFADFNSTIGCHDNVPSAIRKRRREQLSTTKYLPFCKYLMKIGLVDLGIIDFREII